MRFVAKSYALMLDIAARDMVVNRGAAYAQSAERVSEAFTIAFSTDATRGGLAALMLAATDAAIDDLLCMTADGKSYDTWDRHLPLLVIDGLAASTCGSACDVDWALAMHRASSLVALRSHFADLLVLGGYSSHSVAAVRRTLTARSEAAHRACTILDVVGLTFSPCVPSDRCAVLQAAVRAAIVTGGEHAKDTLVDLARRHHWCVNVAGLLFALSALHARHSARERLIARGVLARLAS